MGPSKKKSFYAVAKGRTVGIFRESSQCKDSINKYTNAVYKGFSSINEAVHFLIASNSFSSGKCCNIPVYIDKETVKNVREFAHLCHDDTSSGNNEETILKTVATENNQPTEPIELIDNCTICNKTAEIDTIQCSNCQKWVHFECSELPAYQLIVYNTTTRKYTCKMCVILTTEEKTVERFSSIFYLQN